MAHPADSSNRRKKHLLDAKWQLAIAFGAAALVLAVGLLYLISSSVLTPSDPLSSLSGRETARLALAVNAIYFFSLAGLFFFVALRITHKVTGPALVLARAVEGLREGDFEPRLALRHGDYLKSLAASIQRLSSELQRQRAAREQACLELERAIDRGDRHAAHQLLKELQGTGPASQEPAVGSAA
jgi:hypothetical protein